MPIYTFDNIKLNRCITMTQKKHRTHIIAKEVKDKRHVAVADTNTIAPSLITH